MKVVRVETIEKRSLLYKSKVEYADFCINHVLGCSHGCTYPCYAMMMAKRFGQIKNYADWIKPRLVSNALELLDKEIPKYKDQINFVHLCFTTDPFMYKHKEVMDLSLKIIEKLNQHGIKSTTLTKGIYPVELRDKKKYGYDNIYGITLVSLDERFKKQFEPFSAPFMGRVMSLKRLHDAGLKTWVSIEPYPTPNLIKQDLLELLEKVKIIFGKLNYNVKSGEFKENISFYGDCARKVIRFCTERGIDYHIKYGTQIKETTKTRNILKINSLDGSTSVV
jgi:DNA repair photolyase